MNKTFWINFDDLQAQLSMHIKLTHGPVNYLKATYNLQSWIQLSQAFFCKWVKASIIN